MKNNVNRTGRWLGIVVALVMIVNMMPAAVFADDAHEHTYGEDGYCTHEGCGWYRAMAPEGSEFLYIEAEGKVEIDPQGKILEDSTDYDHVIIPEGTSTVKITYPENSIYADKVFKTTVAYPFSFNSGDFGSSFNPPAGVNEDGTITVTVLASDYLTVAPGQGTGVGIGFDRKTVFTFEERLPEGYYHVTKPSLSKYTVEGEDTATNGYTFSVQPVEGYTPGPNFAVKVNGKVVAEEPGEITLDEVHENIIIDVMDPDVIIKVDLTDITQGNPSTNTINRTKIVNGEVINDDINNAFELGKAYEFDYDTGDYITWGFSLVIRQPNKVLTGMNVNGQVITAYSNEQPIGYNFAFRNNKATLGINFDIYDWESYRPNQTYIDQIKGTYVVKPVFECDGEHDYAPATCLEPETCKKCNMPKEGSTPDTENGHAWDEGEVLKEATLEEEGEIRYTCTICNQTKTEAIPKLTKSEYVEKLISDLPEEVTLDDKEAVDAVQAEFDALTADEKALVANSSVLKAASATIDKLEAEERAAAAEARATAAEAQAASAQAAATAADAKVKEAEAKLKELQEASETDKAAIKKAEEDLAAAQKAKENADAELKKAQDALAEAQKAAEEAKKSSDDEVSALKAKIAALEMTVKGLKVKSKGRKLNVSWKKTSSADGYTVQYKLQNAKKFKTLKTTTKNKVKSKKLKKGKKYQVRVRTYKKLAGKKVYGQWTEIKTVKCK